MNTTPHKFTNPAGVRRAMRHAALYLAHEPEIATMRVQADEFLDGATDCLRRALILANASGDLEAAKRARAALDALA